MDDINTASGVNYTLLDDFKVAAQEAASHTDCSRFGTAPLNSSRGESAFLTANGDHYLAHVEEGLGTKNLVADAMDVVRLDENHWSGIGQDCVAMIVNDLITLGALPLAVAMHLAVGDSAWFTANPKRSRDLIKGWKHACDIAECVWSSGETPELRDIVRPEAVVLSGSAIGRTPGLSWFNPADIHDGDAIVMLESSGVHANGLTKAREIERNLKKGYLTQVPGDNKLYGEVLLTPTHIYVPAIAMCYQQGIEVHYAMNITGHGWRKLMRAQQPRTYVIDELPTRRYIFDFIQSRGKLTDERMYASYNMGAGFALYMPLASARRFVFVCEQSRWPFRAFIAGHVEAGEKRVVIEPKGIELGDTLRIR